jgi:single-strand DNA-binding protein
MAKQLNSISISGRLVRDPEGKTVGDKTVAEFSIANNGFGDKVNFFDVTAWGATADNVVKYLSKGRQVNVSGRLEQRTWEKDGQKRSKVSIVASDVEFVGGRGDTVAGSASAAITVDDGFEPVPAAASEDIPF